MSMGTFKTKTNKGRKKQKQLKDIPLSTTTIENKGFRNKMKKRLEKKK